MTTLTFPMAPPETLKRPYSEVDLDDSRQDPQASPSAGRPDSSQLLTPSNAHNGDCNSLPTTLGRSRANSPARNTPGSTVEDYSSTLQPIPTISTESASKKRKLTFAEKESKRLEKEAKDRLKAEEKARKEAEKQEKEVEKRKTEEKNKEEKRRKDEEKEEKQKAKDAERRSREEERKQKEAEKKAKEDEKQKKERVSVSQSSKSKLMS